MNLFEIERGISMSHLYVDDLDLDENDRLVLEEVRRLFSKELNLESLEALNLVLEPFDPEGWIKLGFAFEYLNHDDSAFRNFYKEDIEASKFIGLNGFGFYEKVEHIFLSEFEKKDDLVFRQDLEGYIDIKRIEYLLDNQFYKHGLDIDTKIEKFLEGNRMHEFIEFEKPIVNRGFNRL